MARTPLLAHLLSAGARCPLGLEALQVAMCTRAKKMEPRGTSLRDKRDRSIGACLTPGLPESLHGYERMMALAVPALRDAYLADAGRPPPLVLALPEPGRPGDDARLMAGIIEDLAARSGVPIDIERSVTVPAGHAAGALAMEAAAGILNAGPQAVFVGGVDSYFHPDTLKWLDEECRLHALDAENGILPSEGAAFFLLSRTGLHSQPTEGAAPSRPLAELRFAQSGIEETIAKGEPNVARAMTQIIRRAAEHVKDGVIPWVLTDVNGERHRLREWSQVTARGSFGNATVHDRFADDLGDMGAAIGPMLAAIAYSFFRAGCAPARSAVVALHSEGAQRGAFVLEEASP